MTFEDGIPGNLADGDDSFNEPFSLTKYSTELFSVGNQSAKFECPIGGEGFGIWGAINNFSDSTGSGYLVNNAGGYSAGASVIELDTGTGTIDSNSVVKFTGDSTLYPNASTMSGTSVTLSKNLTQSLPDDTSLAVVNKKRT